MKRKLQILILALSLTLMSCDYDSRGIIVNDLSDTIRIQMIANDVKDHGFNLGGGLFLSQYQELFNDNVMISPRVTWEDPVFIGEFLLAPKSSYIFGRSMGKFGIPSYVQ